MTTEPARESQTPTASRPKRRRQAPAGRVLTTGAALTATGILVAVMGATGPSTTVQLATQAPAATAAAPVGPTPTTIVVIHRPAASAPVAAASTPGRVVAAPRPARLPAPVATSTAS